MCVLVFGKTEHITVSVTVTSAALPTPVAGGTKEKETVLLPLGFPRAVLPESGTWQQRLYQLCSQGVTHGLHSCRFAERSFLAVGRLPSALGFLLQPRMGRSCMSHSETRLNMCLLVTATLSTPKKFPLTALLGINYIAFFFINLACA